MSGLTDATAIIATLKGATEIGKALITSQGTLDKAELKLKLADLMGELASARSEAADLQDTIRTLYEGLLGRFHSSRAGWTRQHYSLRESPYPAGNLSN